MYLLKITAKREGRKLSTISEEIIEEIPDDPYYLDTIAEVCFNHMQKLGLIPGQKEEAELIS
ncbi:hypothetical protein SDD30_08170 [Moorella naiadis]|uniref:hypothetical protein n=1 Tax=Moorella naiadis (nom. illeg.) TaxID=3093670 RepID=UPI003D9CB270